MVKREPPTSMVRGTLYECAACGEPFRGITTFDRHRVGPSDYCYIHDPEHSKPKHTESGSDKCRYKVHPDRRCLTATELAAIMSKDETGAWSHWRER